MRIWKSHPFTLVCLILSKVYNNMGLLSTSIPKPHNFCNLKLNSSFGDFNQDILISLQDLLNVIGNILPYMLHIYLPLRHILQGSIHLSVGGSLDCTSDDGESLLDMLPHRPLLLDGWYLLYRIWLNFIQSGLGSLFCTGLFVFLLRRVGILSTRGNFLSILITFISFPQGVIASNFIRGITLNANWRLITYTIITNFLFGVSNLVFDYVSARLRLRGLNIFNIYLTHFIIGITFVLNINFGVFASNGTWLWAQYHNFNQGWTVIFSTIFSIIFPAFWFRLGFRNVNPGWRNSFFRAVIEVISFNSVAFCTYIYWSFWVTHVTFYPNLLALIIFGVSYGLIGYSTIYFETYGGRFITYGISYWLMFSSAAMSSNGAFALVSPYVSTLHVVLIIAILNLLTWIIYPNVYRGGIIMTRSLLADSILAYNNQLNEEQNHRWYIIFSHVLIYYILFNNFVFHTGFLFPYVTILFNLWTN